jgi:hypothetical protein
MELIQLIAPGVVFAASIIPLYFAVKTRNEGQRILSSLLFIASLAYGIHSLLESFEVINFDMFVKLCFIVSAFGLMVAYFFPQLKSSNGLIRGIFGIVMMVSFGVWMVGELLESTIIVAEGEQHEIVDLISSVVMGGFGIFIIVRFL